MKQEDKTKQQRINNIIERLDNIFTSSGEKIHFQDVDIDYIEWEWFIIKWNNEWQK